MRFKSCQNHLEVGFLDEQLSATLLPGDQPPLYAYRYGRGGTAQQHINNESLKSYNVCCIFTLINKHGD